MGLVFDFLVQLLIFLKFLNRNIVKIMANVTEMERILIRLLEPDNEVIKQVNIYFRMVKIDLR